MLAASVIAASGNPAKASGHGDSVFSVENPSSAITDFYMFKSFESGQQDKVVFIMNVRPFQEPGAGPVYYPFDTTVTYNINVDNDQDGVADNVIYQIRFKTQFQSPFNNLPISYSSSGLTQISGASGTATASGTTSTPVSTVVLSNTTTTAAATSATTSGTTVVMTSGASATGATTPTTATPTTATQGTAATGVTVTGAATGPSTGLTIVNPGTTTATTPATTSTGTTGTTVVSPVIPVTTPATTLPTGTTSTGTTIGTTSTTTTPTTTVPTTTGTTTTGTTGTTSGTTTTPTVIVPSTGTTTSGSPGAMLEFRPAIPRLSLNTPRLLSASPASAGGTLVAQASTTTGAGTTVVIPGGITGNGIVALSGTGSEGIGLRQTYTIKKLTRTAGTTNFTTTDLGTGTMVVMPPRVGPSTTPDYETLSGQGIFPLANGGRAFAGPRDDTFYADLGAMFDTFNFRSGAVLSSSQDASDTTNPTGFDTVSGYNVATIAIEVPITDITSTSNAVIGAFASTTRSQTTTLMGNGNSTTFNGPQVQVSRAGNPLVADLIIPNSQKTLWNMSDPSSESQFLGSYQDPSLAKLLNSLLGIAVPNVRRDDLTAVFLKYPGQDPTACSSGNGCSELLRLNLAVPPTPPASQIRLGSLNQTGANPGSPDPAGWPNGRRPGDDVLDIFLRLVAGARLNAVPALGDGVNFNIGAEGSNLTANGIKDRFPFLPIPHDGRDRRHIDPGESQ